MTLGEKQERFVELLVQLISWTLAQGYKVRLGEASRSDEQAEINAIGQAGRGRVASLVKAEFPLLAHKILNNGKAGGVRNSLHQQRLAVDLLLFKDEKYLTDTKDYEPIGLHWESLGGTWGGRFRDGNHFSLEHNGVK